MRLGLSKTTTNLLGRIGQVAVTTLIDDAVAVDALTMLLTQAVAESRKPDGSFNMRDVAVFVLRRMKEFQR